MVVASGSYLHLNLMLKASNELIKINLKQKYEKIGEQWEYEKNEYDKKMRN